MKQTKLFRSLLFKKILGNCYSQLNILYFVQWISNWRILNFFTVAQKKIIHFLNLSAKFVISIIFNKDRKFKVTV